MAKHSVSDDGDLRKYYAAIPNIVFTLGLNPYELALYAHLKQAAGDKGGVCWKSRATIAREAGMSAGMVTKARVALETRRKELGGKPLVRVKEEPSKSGGKPTCQITITDIWPINMARFAPSHSDVEQLSPSPDDIATSQHDVEAEAPSCGDEQRHTVTRSTSPHDHKEELLKKNQEELSAHACLMAYHAKRIGKLPDGEAQGAAVKWILGAGFTVSEAKTCYDFQLTEEWRKGNVSWLTVKSRIGSFTASQPKQEAKSDRTAREAELKAKMGWDKLEQRIA